MDRGTRVKFRPDSKAKENWRIGEEMAGLVLARYQSRHFSATERVDVSFGTGIVVWGERASEFVEIGSEKLQ